MHHRQHKATGKRMAVEQRNRGHGICQQLVPKAVEDI